MGNDKSGRGELLTEVRPHIGMRILVGVFTLFTAVLAVGATVGIAAGVNRHARQEPVNPALLVWALPAAFAALFFWVSRQRLRVYSEGTAVRGFGETWLPHADVELVQLSDPKGQFVPESGCAPWRMPSLIARDGRGVRWGGFFGTGVLPIGPVMSAMYRALQAALPLMGERTLECLRAGEVVQFGPVVVALEGIQSPGRRLPWPEVQYIDFGGSGLYVYVRDRPDASFALPPETPNQHLLVWLGQRMPALAAIRAAVELAPAAAKATTALPPVAPVAGFPEQDHELGRLVCGRAIPFRKKWALLAMGTWFALLAPAQWLLPSVFAPGVLAALALVAVPGLAFLVPVGNKERVGLLSLFVLMPFLAAVFTTPVVEIFGLKWEAAFVGVTLPAAEVCLALFGLIGFANARGEGFAVYQHGLRDWRCRIRWEDGRHLTRNATLKMAHVRLEGTAHDIAFSGTDVAIQAACQAVVERALPPLFRRVWATLANGGTFQVGKLRVTREGIDNRGEFVPWEGVYSFKPDQGWFWLWVRGREKPFVALPLHERDALVLLTLIETIFRPHARDVDGLERFALPRDERVTADRDRAAPPSDEIRPAEQA